MKPGDVVDLVYSYDRFVLIVLQGVRVDEESLKKATLHEVVPFSQTKVRKLSRKS